MIFLILIIKLKSENVTEITETQYFIHNDYAKNNLLSDVILDDIFDENINKKNFLKAIGKFIRFIIVLQVF